MGKIDIVNPCANEGVGRLLQLAETFPTLAKREPASVAELARIARDPNVGRGARAAARFVWSVWDGTTMAPPDLAFNLREAWGAWDSAHRAAWQAWASNPWWV